MPLYTRAEIKNMCGIDGATLSVYTKRKKIIMSGEFIDDTIAQNYTQIERWKATKPKREAKAAIGKNIPEKKENGKNAKKNKDESMGPLFEQPDLSDLKKELPPDPNSPEEIRKRNNLAARLKLEDDTKQLTYDSKLLSKKKTEIELEHTKGKLIPTKLVSAVIVALGTGFQNSYKNESSQLLIEIAQRTKMSEEDMAFFKGKLIDIINQSHINAISEAKGSLKSLLEQNQLKK